MGKRKVLLPAAMLLSALSALAGMLPYILIWLIVRELLEHGEITSSGNVVTYAWWAAGMAVASIVLYFAALMSSHLAAFRVESNLRKEAMRQIVRMPLGFFDINTSGRIRKIIDDNAGVTHSFLAHQLPDLAATFLVPLVAAILIFVFDWILGLACIVPVIIAMLVMGFMMNAEGRQFMKSYMTSLEEMNTEAVEYVRGIPVVKVFQQTIYSFKNFHRCIMNYNKMVFGYTRMWEKPMSLYTVIINGFVFFLAPLAILLIGYSGNYASVLLNFFLFVLITPVFSQSIMKSMYLNQALGQASEAIGRLENLVAYEHLTVVEHPQPVKEFSIQFEKVSFSYPGANQKAVDDVSFTIPQGNTVALVGASGGGKTTIARLVPRFWEATEGKVLIGGINVREIAPEELMKYISFVFQNTKLFKTSLLENIKYGNPDATMEEVERAVDMAQCREIINKLPLGLNTKIGTEGTYLSGGEQQMLAIGRALMSSPRMLLMDEPSMGLAPILVEQIFKIIQTLHEAGTTILLVEQITTIDKMVLCNRLCRVTSAKKKQEIEAAVKKQFAMQACMGREAQA